MTATTNDLWAGYAELGTGTTVVTTGEAHCAPTAGQSCLYAQTLFARGGEVLEFEVWAKAASGNGRLFCYMGSLGQILTDVRVESHTEYRRYVLKVPVPSDQDIVTLYLGVGLYTYDTGDVSFRLPALRATASSYLTGIARNGWRRSGANQITASTNDSDVVTLTSAGNVVIGNTSTVTDDSTARRLQVLGNTSATTGVIIGRYSLDNSGSVVSFTKSRNATVGSHTVGAGGDTVVSLNGYISGGAAFVPVASITMSCDGGSTPSGTSAPGTIRLLTTPVSTIVPVEALRIRQDGRITLMGSGGPQIVTGTGTPEAAITAPVGSMFLRSDGGASTTLYIKESGAGNTGWIAK